MATIVGTSDADTLQGGVEADTITGAAGGDRITGGPGFDFYVIGSGESPAAAGLADINSIDTITDWSGSDRLLFMGANPATFGSILQSQTDDYETAYNLAVTSFGNGFEFMVVRVNEDVFVFSIRAGAAVRLPGAGVGDLQRPNFVSGSLDTGLVETGTAFDDLRTLTAASDRYDAAVGNDIVNGLAGADTLIGGFGYDQIFGGPDNDSIDGGDSGGYLRGDDGADYLRGGTGFDDINGNMGNDTIFGGEAMDWVVGGKDEDVIFGEAGNDIVYGNLGNDTVAGGVGSDIVRGGQGDDIVRGDDGDDIVAGDRGMDTITGGLGTDIFLTSGETGIDRVLDFTVGEGDRVQLEPGTTFTLAQVGDDTVITMSGGGQMVLVGVSMASLPNGWIFGG